MTSQRNAEDDATKRSIEQIGRKAVVYAANLASNDSIDDLTKVLLADGHRIDILVNCAGIQRRHASHEFPNEDWDEILQVNLSAVFKLSRNVGAHMLGQPLNSSGKRGSIINIASLMSFQGGLNIPAYAAAKGGIVTLTKALANEWASKGISVNAIAPGYVETDMNIDLRKNEQRMKELQARIPTTRWGKPEDFKGPIVFLASAASAYVSGEVLMVDGGWMGR
ncbi:MAG: hypothetical protein OHK93_006082 [Ramalina farinacea]|uniref:2-deoxy-D-gluconate 3-dehydrogenase n=1 Tax=Ramalina farinacea TaxID=258253 RepID=A0AA43QHV3_9LECA|nr:hypothetical protein [Ramalina farinacea]